MRDVLVVVHAYAGDLQQVLNQMDSYLAGGRPVLVLSPADAPAEVNHPRVTNQNAGKAGWKGKHTVERQLEHWQMALDKEHDWYLLHDSDSVCLSPDLPDYIFEDPERFWCNVINTDKTGQIVMAAPGSAGANYQPPYFISWETLSLAVSVVARNLDAWAKEWEDAGGEIAIDATYANLVSREGFKAGCYTDGYHLWHESDPEWMVKHAGEGLRFWHGVKTKDTYDRMLAAYRRGK